LAALFFYFKLQGSWLFFIVLFLTPDISMIGYLKNTKLGALTYNLVHNYASALSMIVIGQLIAGNILITQIGIIIFAHVSLDRFLGFGLKYPTAFKKTHLQKI
jgi:hypothetical protein